ncbi:MAG: IS1595 family transposase [Pseudomonadota bacterium]
MAMKNRYARRARISEAKTRQLVRCFAADLTALQTAELTGLNRNTVNRFYRALRERIAEACERGRPFFGIVEADESWFGPTRIKGKRGRGAGGKTIVFGIFERQGRVYTEIVPDCSKRTLQGVIRGRVDPSAVINTDGWRGYNGLVDLGYGHKRVDHGEDEFARGAVHINGIEGFWGLAKSRLTRFKGIPKHTFLLHLKECEWRFNHRASDRGKTLLAYLRAKPLS